MNLPVYKECQQLLSFSLAMVVGHFLCPYSHSSSNQILIKYTGFGTDTSVSLSHGVLQKCIFFLGGELSC